MVGRLDVNVELSGGIRDDDSLAAALATGCARVNLGTAALENPQWCARVIAEHGEKVAVGLDVQIVGDEHRLRGRGWESDGGDLWPVLERLDAEGCSRFVVTDVTKDGTLGGPNLELLRNVAECTDAPVIASGECRASMICARSPPSPSPEWKAPSSARRSTPAGSRCRRP